MTTADCSSVSPPENTVQTTKATVRSAATHSPQKIQQIQVQMKHPPPSPPPVQMHHQVQHHAPPANQGARQTEYVNLIAFTSQRLISIHFRNEKPFNCNICGGKFSRYSSLWSHKKLHSGEKNYKCDQCSSSFAKAVYLKNHARIHSGQVENRSSSEF